MAKAPTGKHFGEADPVTIGPASFQRTDGDSVNSQRDARPEADWHPPRDPAGFIPKESKEK